MERVGMILEREANVLDCLLFKLVETHLLLEAGEDRYLPRASREVERTRTRAREIGLLRATTVALVRPGATLRDLATGAPAPWPAILRDHHDVLSRLLAEIELATHRNAVTARAGLDRLSHERTRTLALAGPCGTVPVEEAAHARSMTASGLPVRDAELDRLARGAALDAVMGTAARLHMPDLVDFLR